MSRAVYLILLLLMVGMAEAAIENATIKIYTDMNYSDIWLGISTGGYKLMTETGKDYVIRVFVKNGMPERSLHNLQITPDNFPFPINSITPKSIEQIKPMEIVIYNVNISVPANATPARYAILFDVSSDEFPRGVFKLDSELSVVRRIKTEVYILYGSVLAAAFIIFFYRKIKLSLEGKK